jgi:hypothetical protein
MNFQLQVSQLEPDTFHKTMVICGCGMAPIGWMSVVFKVLRELKVNRALPVHKALPVLMVHKALPVLMVSKVLPALMVHKVQSVLRVLQVHRDSKVFKVLPVRKVLPELMVQKGRRVRRAPLALKAQQVKPDLRGPLVRKVRQVHKDLKVLKALQVPMARQLAFKEVQQRRMICQQQVILMVMDTLFKAPDFCGFGMVATG